MSDINTTAEGIIMCRESILRAKEGIDAALAHLLVRMKEAAAEWDDESYRQDGRYPCRGTGSCIKRKACQYHG